MCVCVDKYEKTRYSELNLYIVELFVNAKCFNLGFF